MASETEIIGTLRGLAGAASKDNAFDIPTGNGAVRVAYYPGSSASLTLSAPYVGRDAPLTDGYRGSRRVTAVRPMLIHLRRERPGDVAAKQLDVAVETQTGDAEFDAAVYIDTPSEPDVVRAVLAPRAVRDGVRELLSGGFPYVALDDERNQVLTTITSFGDVPLDRLPALVETFARVVAEVPSVTASGGAHPIDPWSLRAKLGWALTVLGALPCFMVPFTTGPAMCFESDGDGGTNILCHVSPWCCGPTVLALVFGVVLGVAGGFVVTRTIRGRSSSHTRRVEVHAICVLLALEASVIGANVLSALAR